MQLDRMDYALLRKHNCRLCRRYHRLAPHPVDGGWVVAVVCACRDRNGLAMRYSTETGVLPTLEDATSAMKDLRAGPTAEPPKPRNVYFHGGAHVVQFQRGDKHIHVGRFPSQQEAIAARDAWLEREAA